MYYSNSFKSLVLSLPDLGGNQKSQKEGGARGGRWWPHPQLGDCPERIGCPQRSRVGAPSTASSKERGTSSEEGKGMLGKGWEGAWLIRGIGKSICMYVC